MIADEISLADKGHGWCGGVLVRYCTAVSVGIIGGVFLIAAISAGVKRGYTDEDPIGTWGFLFWGEHYVARMLWSLVASGFGALLAGIIARRSGGLLGVLSVIPTVVLWCVGIYAWTIGINALEELGFESPSLGNKIVSILIPVVSPVIAYWLGDIGGTISEENADRFDSKKHTALGMKWYHWLWVWIPIYVIVVQSAWVVDYGMGWLRAIWSEDVSSLWGAIAWLFFIGLVSTLIITGYGVARAYDRLSDYSRQFTRKDATLGVIKYGLGYPLLACILQGVICLLHYGLILVRN